ncbi:hypothetical protein ACWO06_001019 [Vibrio parahaemolyticus]
MNSSSKIVKWFTYTVIVGLLPILARLLSNMFLDDVAWFAASDFIAFGFVMHISILNELEHMHEDDNWKSIQNGTSIGFVFIYGLLTFALLNIEAGAEQMNPDKLKYCSMIMSSVSFILAYIVFNRLSAKSQSSQLGEAAC